MKTDGGADCILIPGAEKAVAPVTLSMGGACQGGGAKGLVTVTNGDTKTICSKILQYVLRDQPVITSMMNKNPKYKISTTILYRNVSFNRSILLFQVEFNPSKLPSKVMHLNWQKQLQKDWLQL